MADVLLVLTDASDPNFRDQLRVTEELLNDLGAGGKPTLYVFNKCDLGLAEIGRIGAEAPAENVVFISARTGQGIEQMLARLDVIVSAGKRKITYLIPNSDGGALNTLYRFATVESVDYGAESMTVVATVDAKARGMMRRYAVDDVIESEEE